MKPCSRRSVHITVTLVTGTIFALMSIATFFLWPLVLDYIIKTKLPLSPTSSSYELWKDTSSIPIRMEFYFFNWTNPHELRIPNKKPVLVQLGPYTFMEKRQKVNITFHPENSTVSYMQKTTWHFDPDNSNGSLQDKITHLNVVALSGTHKTRTWATFMQATLSFMLTKLNAQIYVIKTVDELLFSGYADKVIQMGDMVPDEDLPPFDRFGWFYMRNGTAGFDGMFNMATGQDDISNLGLVKQWNYKDTMKYYKSPCNVVEGSAGEFFPPGQTKDEITIFNADMCRPMTYEYTRTVKHQGILGYQYTLGEKSLSNETWRKFPHETAKYFEVTTTTEDFFDVDSTTEDSFEGNSTGDTMSLRYNPDAVNMGNCFCNGECTPMGLMNATACRYGAPAFVSLPHFFKADPILRNQVEGMNPNAEEHSFYMTIEPTTGIPLDVAARLQINILLQPSNTVELFKGVPKLYFPIFWFNLRSGTTEDLASSLRLLLNVHLYICMGLLCMGALMILVAMVLHCRRRSTWPKAVNSSKVSASNGKKSELVYMDVVNDDDEVNCRTDRQLYPQ